MKSKTLQQSNGCNVSKIDDILTFIQREIKAIIYAAPFVKRFNFPGWSGVTDQERYKLVLRYFHFGIEIFFHLASKLENNHLPGISF